MIRRGRGTLFCAFGSGHFGDLCFVGGIELSHIQILQVVGLFNAGFTGQNGQDGAVGPQGPQGPAGENGTNGENGIDGQTPVIGVKQFEGIYYWTVNGEWLIVNGQKVKASSTDGKDGENGTNGINGTDGVTPKFKIEEDYWYVSYDNGESWEKLGKASGTNGLNGEDGDSFFKEVSMSDGFVLFTLNDENGTIIKVPYLMEDTLVFVSEKPGDVKTKLTNQQKRSVVHLIVEGYIEDTDVRYIADQMLALEILDLRKTNLISVPSYAFCKGEVKYGKETIREIYLPDCCTSVGGYAFYGCTSLSQITIPENITKIGKNIFVNCSSLTEIIVAKENTKYDSRDNCNAIIETKSNTLISGCQNTIIPYGVTKIGKNAFEDCTSLKEIIIPNSVTKIKDFAFSGCTSLTKIVLPNSITKIKNHAFSDYISTTELLFPNKTSKIGRLAFGNCTSLKEIVIPNSVTKIGEGAFEHCTSLQRVDIPNSITKIRERTFSDCSSLKSVGIPNSVTEFGKWTFLRCTSLDSIDVPESVSLIGAYTFNGCSSLKRLVVDKKNQYYSSIDGDIFTKNQDCIVVVPAGKKLTEYNIPKSVTSIGDGTFSGCSSLLSVDIPQSVTSIGEWSFSDCSSLLSINIPKSVTNICAGAFSECSSLQKVAIPNSVTEIKYRVFYGCSSLQSIHLYWEDPNICNIDGNAFMDMNKDKCSLYVPSGTRWAYRHHPVWGQFKNIETVRRK